VLVTARVQRQGPGLFVIEDRGRACAQGCARTDDAVADRARERRRPPFRPKS
jgi:hypothetical protein